MLHAIPLRNIRKYSGNAGSVVALRHTVVSHTAGTSLKLTCQFFRSVKLNIQLIPYLSVQLP
jgi:hypothetical protein